MGTTVRRLANGRIVVRSAFSWNPDRRTSAQQVKEIGAVHDQCFAARFPTLADVFLHQAFGQDVHGHDHLQQERRGAVGPGLHPSNTLGGAKTFDAQAGYESTTTLMADLAAGANYIWHSAGWNEAGPIMQTKNNYSNTRSPSTTT